MVLQGLRYMLEKITEDPHTCIHGVKQQGCITGNECVQHSTRNLALKHQALNPEPATLTDHYNCDPKALNTKTLSPLGLGFRV